MSHIPGYDPDPDWQPNDAQLRWTWSLIATVKQGASWVMPANGNVYKFDHAARTLWLVRGEEDEMHRRTETAFKALGWSVRRPGDAGEISLAEQLTARLLN